MQIGRFDPVGLVSIILSFYKKLLAWCDYVDSIHPTPPTEVVEFPGDTSNAPLPAVDK